MKSTVRIWINFVLRDLWVGVFVDHWKHDEGSGDFVQRTFICLIPCVPIVIERWQPEFLSPVEAEEEG